VCACIRVEAFPTGLPSTSSLSYEPGEGDGWCSLQTGATHYAGDISDAAARAVPVNQAAETGSDWSVYDEGSGAAASRCCH